MSRMQDAPPFPINDTQTSADAAPPPPPTDAPIVAPAQPCEVWVCEERVGLAWKPIHRGAFLTEEGAHGAVREQSLFAPVGGLRVTRYVPA